jgi:hypothetical protein
VTESPQSRRTAPTQVTPSRPVLNPTPPPIAAPSASAPAQSRWSTPRPAQPVARSERPRESAAPSYSAPAPVPRSAPAPAAAVSRSQPPAPRQDALARPTVNQRSQPVISPAWSSPAASGSARSAPHRTAPQIRSGPQRQYTAPRYQAPAAVPRVAPAPAPAPQQMRSYSPPTASFAPRAQVMPSRPAPAAPSTPATSSSPGRSQSSSGRGRR